MGRHWLVLAMATLLAVAYGTRREEAEARHLPAGTAGRDCCNGRDRPWGPLVRVRETDLEPGALWGRHARVFPEPVPWPGSKIRAPRAPSRGSASGRPIPPSSNRMPCGRACPWGPVGGSGPDPRAPSRIARTQRDPGQLNRRQISALAPLNRDRARAEASAPGTHVVGGGGHAQVRTALYMATLTATRYHPVMRKLLTILNAMIKARKPWIEDHFPFWRLDIQHSCSGRGL